MTRRLLVVADAVLTHRGTAGNALLVEDGRVVTVGPRSKLVRPGVREVRFDGATIVPGLRDAHFHPVAYAATIAGTSLKTASSFAEISARLRAAADAATPSQPLVAIRLDDEALAEGRLPTRDDLDGAVADRPLLVHRYCGHIAVANSAALQRAGITGATPDPEGGIIDRDDRGRPTGVLRETAIDPVSAELAAAVRVTPARLNEAMRGLAGLGITSIGAMTRTGGGPWATLGNEAEILLEAATDLPIRAYSYLIAESVDELQEYATELRNAAGERLTWSGVKRFGDGSLGGHTAAMHEPFADLPGETGTLRLSPLDADLARASLALGGGVAIHAIGDRANGAVIDLFEALHREGTVDGSLRLEHASVLADGDIARLAHLGILASVQPAFMASETEWLEKRVGRDRLLSTYPLASLEAAGVTLAGGSDCPVEPPDPWAGMAVARDRAGIVPAEGLSAASAFRLFTSGAAVALGEPEPLAVGNPADFLVVDRDPLTTTPDELRVTTVIETFVGGERVEVDRSAPVWVD